MTCTILSWNILAESLEQIPQNTDSRPLSWRLPKILETVLHHRPAIIAFQEVELPAFQTISSCLKVHGYHGQHCLRRQLPPFTDTPLSAPQLPAPPFGQAIFWKTALLRHTRSAHIPLRVYSKAPQVIQIIQLRDRWGAEYNVANAHLSPRPNSDIQGKQAHMIVSIAQALGLLGQNVKPHTQLILCGDLNSVPVSPACRYLHQFFQGIGNQDSPWTNVFRDHSKHTIDYILTARKKNWRVSPTRVLDTWAPNFLSDHRPVVSTVSYCSKEVRRPWNTFKAHVKSPLIQRVCHYYNQAHCRNGPQCYHIHRCSKCAEKHPFRLHFSSLETDSKEPDAKESLGEQEE